LRFVLDGGWKIENGVHKAGERCVWAEESMNWGGGNSVFVSGGSPSQHDAAVLPKLLPCLCPSNVP
jgi:hypothetical protein